MCHVCLRALCTVHTSFRNVLCFDWITSARYFSFYSVPVMENDCEIFWKRRSVLILVVSSNTLRLHRSIERIGQWVNISHSPLVHFIRTQIFSFKLFLRCLFSPLFKPSVDQAVVQKHICKYAFKSEYQLIRVHIHICLAHTLEY